MVTVDYICISIPNSKNGILLVTKNDEYIKGLADNVKWCLIENIDGYTIFANADSGIKGQIKDAELRAKIRKKLFKLKNSPAFPVAQKQKFY